MHLRPQVTLVTLATQTPSSCPPGLFSPSSALTCWRIVISEIPEALAVGSLRQPYFLLAGVESVPYLASAALRMSQGKQARSSLAFPYMERRSMLLHKYRDKVIKHVTVQSYLFVTCWCHAVYGASIMWFDTVYDSMVRPREVLKKMTLVELAILSFLAYWYWAYIGRKVIELYRPEGNRKIRRQSCK